MEQQLIVMGISTAKLDPSSNIVFVLRDIYGFVGDQIALQYGGSEAQKSVSTERSESTIAGPIGKVSVHLMCHLAFHGLIFLTRPL